MLIPRIVIFLRTIVEENKHIYTIAKFIYGKLPRRLKCYVRELVFEREKGRFRDVNNIKLAPGNDTGLKAGKIGPKFISSKCKLKTWQIEGSFDGSYSLNIVNRELALALDRIGVDIGLYSERRLGDSGPNRKFIESNSEIEKLYNKSLDRKSCKKDVVSRGGYPPYVGEMDAYVKILHCYAWEESAFPLKWIDTFNCNLHAVSVASRHVKNILINNGLVVPCFVSGLGVDHLKKIAEQKVDVIENFTGMFKFLHISSCFPRKGIKELLRAYFNEFKKEDNVVLIIKTFANEHNRVDDYIKENRSMSKNPPRVCVIYDDLTLGQIKYLYKNCDVLVSPSKAEGFNLPLLEAMVCGEKAITTNWSGHTMFCRVNSNKLIDFSFQAAESHLNLHDSYWANPDIECLQKSLRAMVRNLDKTDLIAINILKNQYTWENVANNIVKNINFLSGVSVDAPRIGWMSTWNKKCGIATYSAKLMKHCPFENVILAPIDDSTMDADELNVARCWYQRRNETFSQAIELIKAKNINVVVIQWHPGIYYGLDLDRFIENLHSLGAIVIISLHSTRDKAAINELRSCLFKIDRILVHTIGDVNRLRLMGAIDNVCLLPHGVELEHVANVTVSNDNSYRQTLTIGTFGFCLPHKGLVELLEAMEIFKKRNPGIKIRGIFLNAIFPKAESKFLAEKIKKLIACSKLEIEFKNDFLEDEKILEILAQVDMLVYPYQVTGESASGAVRYGISLKKPILVTPLEIFDDVKGCVQFSKGVAPNDLADGIEDVYKKILLDKDQLSRVRVNQSEWLEEHSYEKISRRLFEIVYALHQDKILKKRGMIDIDG